MANVSRPSDPILSVAASALQAEQSRMRIIAENMANADSVAKAPGGDPYRRQVPVFAPKVLPDGVQGVAMTKVAADMTPFRTQYEPGHPAADDKGYVKLPNVEPLTEAMDMQAAQRAYQANLNVIDAAREMRSNLINLLNK